MNTQDLLYILRWFFIYFAIGIIFLPTTFYLFETFKDKGYIFSKTIGIALVSYLVFIFGLFKLIPFNLFSIYLSLIIFFAINYIFVLKHKKQFITQVKAAFRIFIFEELVFLLCLIFWAFVRSNSPDINGLEKFMDFGFLNSILRSDFFPPKDMWDTPLLINYYYFGHLVTAVITKLSLIPSYITYNLMIATLFAITFTSSFSLGLNLFKNIKHRIKPYVSGIITALLITMGGNLTTIYAFFKPYIPADNPIPFLKLAFLPFSFPNNFWYPNATRFIPFTIHEFPIYSFVVSDLHGHVLDIPFVLLFIAISLSLFINKKITNLNLILVSFLLSLMYMTNAWDGFIYLLLFLFVICFININKNNFKLMFTQNYLFEYFKKILILILGFIMFSLPFSMHFKPFVSGIGIICSPKFLTNISNIGPFLFEANHCQRSPFWQLAILYGFFYLFVILFIIFLKFKKNYKPTRNDAFILILIIISTILIIVPEFIYVKDIYPMHYRANTMFKLTYEAFIMLSIASGFIIVKLLSQIKNTIILILFFVFSVILLSLILIYPVFAINSYYKDLKNYQDLNGINYLSTLYPGDYNLINFINKNIKGQPVILEATGESYTNYARISANTGLPTVMGWTVHEWLWRGTYDLVAPKITDVETLYTTKNFNLEKQLIKKYFVSYVVVSVLEKEKYLNLNENNFKVLGKLIYQSKETKLYKISY